jgi:signal transduction histidine kinase
VPGPVTRLRARAVSAAIVLVGLAGAGLFGLTHLVAFVPATTAVMALIVALHQPAGGRRVPVVVSGVAVLSIAWTATLIVFDRRLGSDLTSGLLVLGETVAMLLALVRVVARATPRSAAVTVALCVIAVGAIVLRSAQADWSLTTVLGCVVWAMLALGASAAGLYLRWLAARQAEAIRAAARANRLQLAADLHDYVAHDVSEMLALAQAGQIISTPDLQQAREVFGAIAQAALHSMGSLDRAVKTLGDTDTDTEETAEDKYIRRPGLVDLDELVRRFRRSEVVSIELEVDPQLVAATGEETSALVYRVVVEALTNVRRHAPTADRVQVEARRSGEAIQVSVVDDGRWADGTSESGRSSGLGLSGLNDRVTALGGALVAGPREPTGWQVTVSLPL